MILLATLRYIMYKIYEIPILTYLYSYINYKHLYDTFLYGLVRAVTFDVNDIC